MRRSASEIIRNLEMRIARLERQSSTNRRAVDIGMLGEERVRQGLHDELLIEVSRILGALNQFYMYDLSNKGNNLKRMLDQKATYEKRTGDFTIAKDAVLVEGTFYDGKGTNEKFMICLDHASYSKKKVGKFDWIVSFFLIKNGKEERLTMIHKGEDYKTELKRVLFVGRRASSNRTASLNKSTGLEMVNMIESQYDEYGLDEDYIEIEGEGRSRATGDTYMLVSLEGYYGIVRIDGRHEDVEMVSDDYRSIKRVYDNNLG